MPYFGVCYSPNHRTVVKEQDVDDDMALIAKKFTHIRTYSTEARDNCQWNVAKAAKHKLKTALGVWLIANDDQKNRASIDNAVNQAESAALVYPNPVVHFVIGNEVDRPENPITPDEVHKWMDYAKQRKNTANFHSIPVTTCLSGTVLQFPGSPWLKVIDFCDGVVYLTVYPWYAEKKDGAPPPDDIRKNMDWSWGAGLSQVVARGKKIVIAEIGWPSAGGNESRSPTTPENERINFLTTKKFLSGQTDPHWNLDTFWFEMFDEAWKTEEGPWGPHWGLYTSGPNPQAKFDF